MKLDVNPADKFKKSAKSISELSKENTRNRIVKAVLQSKNGINHGVLSKIVGIDRKNLRPYMKDLQAEKVILRGSNRKYYIGENALELLGARLFVHNFVEKVLSPDGNLTLNRSNLFLSRERVDTGLERTIFEFSNKIGAFITYVIIQSLSLSNEQNDRSKLENESYDFYVSDRWIKKYIDIIIPLLPFIFKEELKEHLDLYSGGETLREYVGKLLDYSYKLPILQLDKRLIDQINTSFSRLYPELHSSLEKIRKDLPNDIQELKDHSAYIQMRIASERRCKHCYKKNPPRLLEDNGIKTWTSYFGLKHCIKCHHTIFPK